ncbi:Pnap_2097 family protein [Rhizobium straminoryzae]|nr:Pnap_2097 family protein [Rhizobium straminoryzae]
MTLPASAPCLPPQLTERHVLGMAEMGYLGLSEQWLLRRAGDMHWRLIARAMGQREAVFTCAAGEPLYAAFCATRLYINSPERPRLGGELTLAADLYRVGHGRLASVQRIKVDDSSIGHLILISTFVGRADPSSNRSIVRRAPKVLVVPPDAPALVQRMARSASDAARSAGKGEMEMPAALQSASVRPCPSTDFNAVGLLYFPSFSALAERAVFEAGASHVCALQSRNVVYLGNLEPGERVTVAFNQNPVRQHAFLRGEDERLIAVMRTRYCDMAVQEQR